MAKTIIDTHIHLDMYSDTDRDLILGDMEKENIQTLIAVSNHLASSKETLRLARAHTKVKPAFGYHPEQTIPTQSDIEKLKQFIYRHREEMIAVGEVGLPYYLRKNSPEIPLEPYLELLEEFIKLAGELDKPIILHAIYEDADIVCDLLEKHKINKAHFHWFKGDAMVLERIRQNAYYISVTPDVLYESEIQTIVRNFPIQQMMVETDGPWPFEGEFSGQITHPKMIHQSIFKIAELKRMDVAEVYRTMLDNAQGFYNLHKF